MPTARHGLGSAVLDQRFYVISGGPTPGGSYSDRNEIFIPVPSIKSSVLNYLGPLNLSANPGTLAGHDYFAPIDGQNPSLDFQDAIATHP